MPSFWAVGVHSGFPNPFSLLFFPGSLLFPFPSFPILTLLNICFYSPTWGGRRWSRGSGAGFGVEWGREGGGMECSQVTVPAVVGDMTCLLLFVAQVASPLPPNLPTSPKSNDRGKRQNGALHLKRHAAFLLNFGFWREMVTGSVRLWRLIPGLFLFPWFLTPACSHGLFDMINILTFSPNIHAHHSLPVLSLLLSPVHAIWDIVVVGRIACCGWWLVLGPTTTCLCVWLCHSTPACACGLPAVWLCCLFPRLPLLLQVVVIVFVVSPVYTTTTYPPCGQRFPCRRRTLGLFPHSHPTTATLHPTPLHGTRNLIPVPVDCHDPQPATTMQRWTDPGHHHCLPRNLPQPTTHRTSTPCLHTQPTTTPCHAQLHTYHPTATPTYHHHPMPVSGSCTLYYYGTTYCPAMVLFLPTLFCHHLTLGLAHYSLPWLF